MIKMLYMIQLFLSIEDRYQLVHPARMGAAMCLMKVHKVIPVCAHIILAVLSSMRVSSFGHAVKRELRISMFSSANQVAQLVFINGLKR